MSFPNLARSISTAGSDNFNFKQVLLPNATEIVAGVTATIIDEFVAAGIPRVLDHYKIPNQGPFDMFHGDPERLRLNNGYFPEVPTSVVAFYNGWKFERRWYYYAASGDGIPPVLAEEFHKTWGRQVRVEGHCGCPSPMEYCHGFAVGSYHIDTPEGLKAFIGLLDKVYTSAPRPTITIEGVADDIKVEDSGMARIIEIADASDDSFFLRLQSWDDRKGEERKHDKISSLEGQRLRITIEVLEDVK